MKVKEAAELLQMDPHTFRMVLQNPNNPFGWCERVHKQNRYFVNASKVIEYAGKEKKDVF